MNDQVFRLIQFLFPGCNDEPDQNDVQQEPSKIIIMYSTSNLVKILLKQKKSCILSQLEWKYCTTFAYLFAIF